MAEQLVTDAVAVERTTTSEMEEKKDVSETPQNDEEHNHEESRQCESQSERDPQPQTIEGENDSSVDDDFCDPSANSIEEIDEEEETEDKSREPWSILRKGAVAAVGGTMVGVGLVMVRSFDRVFCSLSAGTNSQHYIHRSHFPHLLER